MSDNTVTFYRVVPMSVDIDKARAHYCDPDLDFTSDERAKLLEIVNLVEKKELGKALDKYQELSRGDREYLMVDIANVFEKLGFWGDTIYLDEPKTGIYFKPTNQYPSVRATAPIDAENFGE